MLDQFLQEILPAVLDYRLALAAVAALASALIRGYAGFGVAMMMVPALSILYGPIEAIAITIMVGLVGQSQLFPGASRIANWPELTPMLVTILVATPLGTLVLFAVDPQVMRRVIGLIVVGGSLALATGWTYGGRRGRTPGAIAGMLTGLVTGSTGLGAPLAAVYFLSGPYSVAVQRANIIISMCALIIVMLVPFIWSGNIDSISVARAAALFPVAIIGTRMGSRLFVIAPQEHYKRYALGLLLLTGVATLIF